MNLTLAHLAPIVCSAFAAAAMVRLGTQKRMLVIRRLWTEACMALTALGALSEGYEVYPGVDEIGSASVEAHRAAWHASRRIACARMYLV